MMAGLLGMAYYSAPSVSHPSPQLVRHDSEDTEGSPYHPLENEEPDDEADMFDDEAPAEEAAESDESDDDLVVVDVLTAHVSLSDTHTICCGMKFRRRTLGILAAMFSGIYGGSIMAPMKFAPPDAKGSHFLISFAIGAATANLALWVIRYLYLCQRHGSMSRAYGALPSFHFRKMWLHGGACGILWSIGNFFSIISVEFLGEGVGYSVVQAAMLGTQSSAVLLIRFSVILTFLLCYTSTVSGLWGIFYFKEIEETETITKWFLSASVTVLGILLLSYEHHEI
jgi:hypothetical protein